MGPKMRGALVLQSSLSTNRRRWRRQRLGANPAPNGRISPFHAESRQTEATDGRVTVEGLAAYRAGASSTDGGATPVRHFGIRQRPRVVARAMPARLSERPSQYWPSPHRARYRSSLCGAPADLRHFGDLVPGPRFPGQDGPPEGAESVRHGQLRDLGEALPARI